jgi:hypothetical protein
MQTAAPEIDPTTHRSTLTPNLTPSGARTASLLTATASVALCVADQVHGASCEASAAGLSRD